MDFRLILKVAITAVVIVAISEIGKRSSFFAALLASLPLTSLLALSMVAMELETQAPHPRLLRKDPIAQN